MAASAAAQEGGWPLGLHPVNMRVGMVRHFDSYGSLSFNTFISGSPTSSSFSSSDLDSESTRSYSRDTSATLASLIGVDFSSRSIGTGGLKTTDKRNHKARTWWLSLCPNARLRSYKSAVNNAASAQSLGQYLEFERRASSSAAHRGSSKAPNITYELHGLAEIESQSAAAANEHNTLFSDGLVAPPAVHSSNHKYVDVTNSRNGNSSNSKGLGQECRFWFRFASPCSRGH